MKKFVRNTFAAVSTTAVVSILTAAPASAQGADGLSAVGIIPILLNIASSIGSSVAMTLTVIQALISRGLLVGHAIPGIPVF
ncbi:hypothetical protein P4N68_04250 [Corynebacterium felinum]|uniref:Secreted protein n=1 Tax=Corynebacterium felinum TaxID=131318 RepID=A0ABU2B9D6_9CORY|nr:hypothetical protein [Corynebacterium felinum]MDF5820297.1 hypothetical protein [Corynebacterium felinum]MDR7354996.1 hypothetical protein [Corynebacterium felinum]WJY94350.1 hypothetical protein CFELI_03580 [Corynebacterium felinum]